jgi:HK97 family phage major capsid protein
VGARRQEVAMSTQTGASGGFPMPTEFLAKLLALVTENSIVRPRATVIPTSARSVQIPAFDVTTAPAAGDTASSAAAAPAGPSRRPRSTRPSPTSSN